MLKHAQYIKMLSSVSFKVYATEVTARLGKMAMEELVEMHGEFVKVYGLEEDGCLPKWMDMVELRKLSLALKEIVMGDNGEDLASWVPLYRYLHDF